MEDDSTSQNTPSVIQCTRFVEIAGYPYPADTTKGTFKTNRPYNDAEWKLSPWWVRYTFHEDTGYLFCELSHRMTNNRCYGWDRNGLELSREVIEQVYPSHF